MGSGDWARNTELSQDAGVVPESSLTRWFMKRVVRTLVASSCTMLQDVDTGPSTLI